MPGELGNEEEQQSVGYYERRYVPRGDPTLDEYANVSSWDTLKPRDKFLKELVEKKKE